MSSGTDLPDVNVWFALGVPDHRHHGRARDYWYEEAGNELALCRTTVMGYLRLLTNPRAMGGDPLTVLEAWEAYERVLALPEVRFVPEPSGCDGHLASWANGEALSRRLWTDAYLAAFAVSAGFRLVTFDRDFARFSDLEHLWLSN